LVAINATRGKALHPRRRFANFREAVAVTHGQVELRRYFFYVSLEGLFQTLKRQE
jgi:hypothetical protein